MKGRFNKELRPRNDGVCTSHASKGSVCVSHAPMILSQNDAGEDGSKWKNASKLKSRLVF